MNYGEILTGVLGVLSAMNNDAELEARIAELDAATTAAREDYEAKMARLDELEAVVKTRDDDEVRGALS